LTDPTAPPPHRRKGPIGFSAEQKVTTFKGTPSTNAGGIGQASGPTSETPKRSKELHVAPILVWVILGVLVMIAGAAVVEPVLIAVGAIFVVGGFLTQRMNRTETRLRDEFRDKGDN
jgi:hypothetical protein